MEKEKGQKSIKGLTLLLACLFLGMTIGGSGLISVEHEENLTFMQMYGESPLDRVRVEFNATRIAFSNKRVTFLERFDDADMGENPKWTYYETGCNLSDAQPWVGASNLLLLTAADGSNYTKLQYSIPASKSTGLKPNSDGVIVTARCGEVHGTPVGGLELTTGTHYIRVFFDGSGNIDITYHIVTTGTLTTIDNAVASATANKWYSFQIELHSATALVKIFNETGIQLGSTQTLSTYMTYSTFSNMTIWANTTAAADKILGFDWIYATPRYTSAEKYEEVEILPNSKDSAPKDKETKNCESSYVGANIENDSATQIARDVFNLTESQPGDFDSTKTFNRTEFQDFQSTISEKDYDLETTQTFYAKGWNDLRSDVEGALDSRLERITGESITVVDYVLLDLNVSVVYSSHYVTLVRDWFKDEGVDIILEQDPDCQITLQNGDVISAASMPREVLGAFLCGQCNPGLAVGWGDLDPRNWRKKTSSVLSLGFSDTAKAMTAMLELMKGMREDISNLGGIIEGSVNSIVDSTTNIIQQSTGAVKDHLDTYVVAPVNAILASVGAGFSSLNARLVELSNSFRNAIDGAVSSIATTIRGMVDSLPTVVSDAIGAAYDGLISPFMDMVGKAIAKALSVFNFVGPITSMLKTYLLYGGIILVVGVALFIAYRKGMFDRGVNKASGLTK